METMETTEIKSEDNMITIAKELANKMFDENSKKTLGFYNNVQVDLLNFAFHISPKVALGFFVRGRTVTNIDNLDPKLAVLAETQESTPIVRAPPP